MEFKDYYGILGVDAKADLKTIKTAYRRLARKYHPDLSKEKDAEDQFKTVAEAYEVLKDANKRAEYDQLRQYGARPDKSFTPPPGWRESHSSSGEQFSGDFSEFFETLFGSAARDRSHQQKHGPHAGHRGQDIEMELPIFLEDTLKDETKSVRFEIPGVGGSTSAASTTKHLQVKIPKGITDGERIRLKGQGVPGIGDGPSGDLYLHIRLVPHPLFDVEGHNLIITVPLAPWEAALGRKITIPTLGGKIQLTVSPNTPSGQRQRIKGKGLANKIGGVGDLYAIFNVVMPSTSNERMTKLWKELASIADFNPRSEWSEA